MLQVPVVRNTRRNAAHQYPHHKKCLTTAIEIVLERHDSRGEGKRVFNRIGKVRGCEIFTLAYSQANALQNSIRNSYSRDQHHNFKRIIIFTGVDARHIKF